MEKSTKFCAKCGTAIFRACVIIGIVLAGVSAVVMAGCGGSSGSDPDSDYNHTPTSTAPTAAASSGGNAGSDNAVRPAATLPATATPAASGGNDESGTDNVAQTVLPEAPTGLTFKVSYKNGSEMPIAAGQIALTGDGAYDVFEVEIVTGELSATYEGMQEFLLTAYIPASDCYSGLVYRYDDFDANGAVRFISYDLGDLFNNLYNWMDFETFTFDYSAFGESSELSVENIEFIIYEYSPQSYATFSVTAEVTVNGTSYTLEAAGTSDYLVEVQETCAVCYGNGICRVCDGTGTNGATGIFAGSCPSCGGNKRCSACDGTGVVTVMRSNR